MNYVETESVYVRYLGNKPQKYDTIFGTPTVWTPGAVRLLQVPKGQKVRLLQHKDVWEEVSADEMKPKRVLPKKPKEDTQIDSHP